MFVRRAAIDKQRVAIDIEGTGSASAARIRSIAKRHIEGRTGAKVAGTGKADWTLHFGIDSGIGTEGFRIEDGLNGAILILGNDERGLLYGLGKFLRSSGYAGRVFTPGAWRGTSVPDKPIRGTYFATHFHNFYHEAPLKEVEQYLEDMALWGINALTVWYDMHHYKGIDDPNARRMIVRLKSLLNTAKKLGLSTSLVFIANEAYANSPVEMRADGTAGHDGYTLPLGGFFGIELCPNKPGARKLMLRWVEERLQAFADIAPDYLWIWPYDQGGCSCSRCAPWGANGFLSMAEPTARLYKKYVPHGKIILSTWYFDRFTKGEWAGLHKAFGAEKPDWVDCIMADDNDDTYPEYPLRHGVPGDLPLLNFPEISMYKSFWGGMGANPLPHHLQALWDMASNHLSGGFPYSEGIYEDINKTIVAQLQWKKNRKAMDIVREYIAFEFSPDVVNEVAAATEILEKNNQHSLKEERDATSIPMESSKDAGKALALLKVADKKLPPVARKSWRWRILYLREWIDAELAANKFRISARCEKAFDELVKIYHAENAALVVSPPTRKALRLKRPW